jgi:hypothetical protein
MNAEVFLTGPVGSEVYVSDFGLARVKESEEEAGYTKQSFGPVGVCPSTQHLLSIHYFVYSFIGHEKIVI